MEPWQKKFKNFKDDDLSHWRIVGIPTEVTDEHVELEIHFVHIEHLEYMRQMLEQRAISYQQETGKPLPPFWPKI